MTRYEYYKDKYKRTAYPLIDEHDFDLMIAEIRDEILNEKLENENLELKENIKSVKKNRRMTYKELNNWLEQGKGVIKIANIIKNTISYDYEDRNNEVSSYYKICGYDEDTWHEPLIDV